MATFPVRSVVNFNNHMPRPFLNNPARLSIIVVRCNTEEIRHSETYSKLVPQY